MTGLVVFHMKLEEYPPGLLQNAEVETFPKFGTTNRALLYCMFKFQGAFLITKIEKNNKKLLELTGVTTA